MLSVSVLHFESNYGAEFNEIGKSPFANKRLLYRIKQRLAPFPHR